MQAMAVARRGGLWEFTKQGAERTQITGSVWIALG
jgi:hypothetical protein